MEQDGEEVLAEVGGAALGLAGSRVQEDSVPQVT